MSGWFINGIERVSLCFSPKAKANRALVCLFPKPLFAGLAWQRPGGGNDYRATAASLASLVKCKKINPPWKVSPECTAVPKAGSATGMCVGAHLQFPP